MWTRTRLAAANQLALNQQVAVAKQEVKAKEVPELVDLNICLRQGTKPRIGLEITSSCFFGHLENAHDQRKNP